MGLLLFAFLIAGTSGFRVRPKQRAQKATTQGLQGQIDGVFAYAAPGLSSPPLRNFRGGPCFPGTRSWTRRKRWFGQEVDIVTTIARVLGFRHPYMEGMALDLKKNKVITYPCDSGETDTSKIPKGWPKNIHEKELYHDMQQHVSDLHFNMSSLGLMESYTMSRTQAAQNAASNGWSLIGSATDDGGKLYVGMQVSHLFQQPETKACIVTFQGSSSTQDWLANANVQKTNFCGFAGVHRGFRDALRKIVQNRDWQSDVRPKLSSCSKVYVSGHSLGAAEAELFAACVQRAPQEGDTGYQEDYKFVGWTQGR